MVTEKWAVGTIQDCDKNIYIFICVKKNLMDSISLLIPKTAVTVGSLKSPTWHKINMEHNMLTEEDGEGED